MDDFVMPLVLGLDASSLTMSLVNIASPGGAETALADSVEAALRPLAHLDVDRVGDTVVARARSSHDEHVVVVAHLDTLAVEGDSMAYVEMGKLYGPGASSAKGALAMALKAAAAGGYRCDVTFVFVAERDGLPGSELRHADIALLAAPTNSRVVGGTLDDPWARRLVELADTGPTTDDGDEYGLSSFGALAVAFGPGDPSLAGTPDEFVPTAELSQCEFVLRRWLTA